MHYLRHPIKGAFHKAVRCNLLDRHVADSRIVSGICPDFARDFAISPETRESQSPFYRRPDVTFRGDIIKLIFGYRNMQK